MFLIPWWVRLVALAALVVALYGGGWIKGRESGKAAGDAELAHFKAQVETEGAKQAVHTAQVIQKQTEVSQNVAQDYKRRLAALTPASVPDIHPDGSAVAEVSCAPARTDGTPADPVPAVAQADFDELKTLAAQTTQQLLSLQDWVRQQQAAF